MKFAFYFFESPIEIFTVRVNLICSWFTLSKESNDVICSLTPQSEILLTYENDMWICRVTLLIVSFASVLNLNSSTCFYMHVGLKAFNFINRLHSLPIKLKIWQGSILFVFTSQTFDFLGCLHMTKQAPTLYSYSLVFELF